MYCLLYCHRPSQDYINPYDQSYCVIYFQLDTQETTTNIVFRLLDKVMAAELIPSAIEKQVGPYMANHGLKRDKMLLEYVKVNCFRCVGSLFLEMVSI